MTWLSGLISLRRVIRSLPDGIWKDCVMCKSFKRQLFEKKKKKKKKTYVDYM